jgi:hypothetical protein
MTNPTDPVARLVFDFGTSTIAVSVTEIKVEELTTLVTAIEESVAAKLSVYPNPVRSILHVNDLDSYKEATVLDTRGQTHLRISITPGTETLNFETIPSGFYVIRLVGNGHPRII